jgi:hypothetical protein
MQLTFIVALLATLAAAADTTSYVSLSLSLSWIFQAQLITLILGLTARLQPTYPRPNMTLQLLRKRRTPVQLGL